MLAKFEEEGANLMQRLAVQMLCYQLDSTWQYFTRTFKMQVSNQKKSLEIIKFHLIKQTGNLDSISSEFSAIKH